MDYTYNDGGRLETGYQGKTRDCVTRAIAIAMQQPYQLIFEELNEWGSRERKSKRRKSKSSASTGIHIPTIRKYLASKGWRWVPTMLVGQGCKVHLRKEELPSGRLIVSVSRHVVAIIDGTINDTSNPARNGARCVYGYYVKDACEGRLFS